MHLVVFNIWKFNEFMTLNSHLWIVTPWRCSTYVRCIYGLTNEKFVSLWCRHLNCINSVRREKYKKITENQFFQNKISNSAIYLFLWKQLLILETILFLSSIHIKNMIETFCLPCVSYKRSYNLWMNDIVNISLIVHELWQSFFLSLFIFFGSTLQKHQIRCDSIQIFLHIWTLFKSSIWKVMDLLVMQLIQMK